MPWDVVTGFNGHEAMTVIYDKITIIGMGLIGASLALAARRRGWRDHRQ